MNDIVPATTRATALTPRTYQEAVEFAALMSKSNMIPQEYRGRPENILLALQLGAELGLSPLQAVQSICTINGRPTVYGDAALALVRASPACDDVIESFEGSGEDAAAVCTAKRRGKAPVVARFGVREAKRAGLWGKSGPWTQYPRRMLQMRARSFALRDAFPDVLRGLIVGEEGHDYVHAIDVTPARDTRGDLDAFAGVTDAPEAPQETPTPQPDPPRRSRSAPDSAAEPPRAEPDASPTPSAPVRGERIDACIEVPQRGGRADYRAWAMGLFLPRLRQHSDSSELAMFLGLHESELAEAKKVLAAGDLRLLNEAITAQWNAVA